MGTCLGSALICKKSGQRSNKKEKFSAPILPPPHPRHEEARCYRVWSPRVWANMHDHCWHMKYMSTYKNRLPCRTTKPWSALLGSFLHLIFAAFQNSTRVWPLLTSMYSPLLNMDLVKSKVLLVFWERGFIWTLGILIRNLRLNSLSMRFASRLEALLIMQQDSKSN